MQDMVALTTYFAVQFGDSEFCFLSVLGAFLSPGDDALGVGETCKGVLQVPWVFDLIAVAISDEEHDAAIKGNDGCRSRRRWWYFDLANDRCEPLVGLTDKSAALGDSLKRSMLDDSHRAEFRKMQTDVIYAPDLGMRLAQSDMVHVLSLPARLTTDLPKAALPSTIQIDDELGADIARNIGEPRQFSAQFGQLIYLIERRVELFVAP